MWVLSALGENARFGPSCHTATSFYLVLLSTTGHGYTVRTDTVAHRGVPGNVKRSRKLLYRAKPHSCVFHRLSTLYHTEAVSRPGTLLKLNALRLSRCRPLAPLSPVPPPLSPNHSLQRSYLLSCRVEPVLEAFLFSEILYVC